MTQVAFVKTPDRVSGVKRALDLLDLGPMTGKDIFIKPNFNSADTPPGSTHNVPAFPTLKLVFIQAARQLTIG